MNEFRQKVYLSPQLPYVLLAVGGLLLFFGVVQIGSLANYFFKYFLGTIAWRPDELVGALVRVVVHFVLGSYAIVGGRALIMAKQEESQLRERYHDRPWLRNKQWAQGYIRNDDRMTMVLFCLASVSLLALLAINVRMIIEAPPADRHYWFAVVLVVTIYVLIRGYLLNRKWRASELRLGTIPGIIGGPLEAVVILNESFVEGTPFRLTLTCEQIQWRRNSTSAISYGSRDDESTEIVSEKVWQDDQVVDKFIDTGIPGTTGIPVYFAVPFDSDPTTVDDIERDGNLYSTRWSLKVTRDDTNDFRSVQFHVPVFLTAESSPDYQEDTALLRPYAEIVTAESILARIRYRSETLADGVRLEFSLRRWDLIITGFALSLLSGVGLVAAWAFLNPWVLCLIASIVPAGTFVASTLGIWEMIFWQSEILIRDDTLDITAGYLFFAKRVSLPRRLAIVLESQVEFATAVSDFRRIQIGLKLPGGGKTTEQDGQKNTSLAPQKTVIKRLPGRQRAEIVRRWLAEQILG